MHSVLTINQVSIGFFYQVPDFLIISAKSSYAKISLLMLRWFSSEQLSANSLHLTSFLWCLEYLLFYATIELISVNIW